jgi:hypothetical protein
MVNIDDEEELALQKCSRLYEKKITSLQEVNVKLHTKNTSMWNTIVRF